MWTLVLRGLALFASIALVGLAFAWWAIGHLGADTGDGTPCGGTTAATVQLILAYCGAACALWLSAAIVRAALWRRGASWRIAAPILIAVAGVWLAVYWLPCALSG